MRHARLFVEERLRDEFLDRFNDLTAAGALHRGGLERLDALPLRKEGAERAVKRMTEGVWGGEPADSGGLEAIIERFTRPVHLVQDHTFRSPADEFPNSQVIGDRLNQCRQNLDSVIPSAGRVEVANHRHSWIGTSWMVKPNVVVTNRHVAEEFARAEGAGFSFRRNALGRQIKASVDWRREWARTHESVFRVTRVLWIEPDESFDVALLEVVATGEAGDAQPMPIQLATLDEIERNQATGAWVAVIGYPAQDSRNNAADQQRIFDGIYNVKRLAPGQIRAIQPDGLLTHDATTLGGNSGSAVIDLVSGKAVALHFGGLEGESNYAVQAPRIQDIVAQHVT